MSSIHEGKKFGALTVLDGYCKPIPSGKSRQILIVRCDCGREYEIAAKSVLGAKHPMCRPCRNAERRAASQFGYKHPLHGIWQGMIQRCYMESTAAFKYYGGRGIIVCERWRGVDRGERVATISGFRAFLEDMGERPEGTSLDRIDVNGDYSPENCRWADWLTQANNRTDTVLVEFAGESKTIAAWGREFGVPHLCDAARAYGVPYAVAVERASKLEKGKRVNWVALFDGIATKRPVRLNVPKLQWVGEPYDEFCAWLDTFEV